MIWDLFIFGVGFPLYGLGGFYRWESNSLLQIKLPVMKKLLKQIPGNSNDFAMYKSNSTIYYSYIHYMVLYIMFKSLINNWTFLYIEERVCAFVLFYNINFKTISLCSGVFVVMSYNSSSVYTLSSGVNGHLPLWLLHHAEHTWGFAK